MHPNIVSSGQSNWSREGSREDNNTNNDCGRTTSSDNKTYHATTNPPTTTTSRIRPNCINNDGDCTGSSSSSSSSRNFTRSLWTSRVMFVTCLCAVAACLGYGAHKIIASSEHRLAEQHFDAIAQHALEEARHITERKRLGAKALASVVSNAFPDHRQWPNVSLFGFERIAAGIMDTAEAFTMGLCPLVWSEQLREFEDFAYDTAFTKINRNYPNTTGLRDFNDDGQLERGVHGFSQNFTLYRVTDGQTDWNSKYQVITPFIMHSHGPPILMFDLHSMARFGTLIDDMLECAWSQTSTVTTRPQKNDTSTTLDTVEEEEEEALADISYLNECAMLSDMTIMYDEDGEPTGPSAHILQPIYPANNKSMITGFITSTMRWNEVLERLFNLEVSGVDCVLETETQSYTYSVQGGVASFVGEGRLHDPSFEVYAQTIGLSSPGIFSNTSATYTLIIYPNEILLEVYATDNPAIAMAGTLCIILFTSILFVVYDHVVQQELYHRQAITKARRCFVRFISHEIRTPMNTICIGSRLLEETMSKFAKQFSGNKTTGTASSASQVISQQQNVQEQLKDWSELISDVLVNANCAVNVLGDLLNYDNISETGKLPLELSIIPIWSLVKRASSEFRLASVAKNIQYSVDCSKSIVVDRDSENSTGTENLLDSGEEKSSIGVSGAKSMPVDVSSQYVVGDAVRISQVIRSFISNAFEFTQNGGEISVQVTWKPLSIHDASHGKPDDFVLERGNPVNLLRRGYVQVDVKDSGTGLTREELQSLLLDRSQFDLDKLQSGQGSGLGLYMSKGIAEQHGGYVDVSSKGYNKGTCFTLVLPLHNVPESDLPENLRNRKDLEQSRNSASSITDSDSYKDIALRILVVDDAKLCRKLVMRLLKTKNHVCDEAENGQRAVEMVQASMEEGNPYDVVLLDCEMPVMKGPEAAKELRKIGSTSFVAGVTGNMLPEDVHFFKENGADCVLGKPLNMSDLESRWVEHGVYAAAAAAAASR